MYWEVMIPGDEEGTLDASVTVNADNWFSALRDALNKHNLSGQVISNLTCDIKPDKNVHVTDFVTRKLYILKPLNNTKIEIEPTEKLINLNDDLVLPEDLPTFRVFFSRDEAPDDGSAIFYRERLIVIDESLDREASARMSSIIFEQLKSKGSDPGTKLFISVQIFDHEFETRSERPAITVLTWKEWSPKKTQIQFPLSGEESMRLNCAPKVSTVKSSTLIETVPADPQPIDLVAVNLTPKNTDPQKSKPIDLIATESAPIKATMHSEPKTPTAKTKTPDKLPKKELVVEDAIVAAFEKIQDIYAIRHYDDVAQFALTLCSDFVDCEAGSAMLITPGKYELYVAAAKGKIADQIIGKKLSLTDGIVGFATRTGVVITVSDPENDPRFNGEVDSKNNFKTRNVVCTPIQHEGKVIGAIELINSPRQTGFMQNEANVLSYIAGVVGEYIETSLPSREADFNDREFAEFLLPKRKAPKKNTTRNTPATKQKISKNAGASVARKPTTSKPKLKKKRKKR